MELNPVSSLSWDSGARMRADVVPTPPLLLLLLLLLLLAAPAHAWTGRTSDPDAAYGSAAGFLMGLSRPANSSRIFYGVMFDAGSTGTRIHVYTFIHQDTALPVLDNEMFHSIKPGLSAYADSPETAAHTVKMLLKVAKKTVPRLEWKRTPVILRATAGLRLLAPEKAQALLEQVEDVLEDSPFLLPDDGVGMMDGTSEGVLAWITINFLTGHLYANTQNTVGILDLGGGSTQITFLPNLRKTIESSPGVDYVAQFEVFNSSHQLYSHSYLGNGLMAGRLATLGALGAEGLEWRVFTSACLPNRFSDQWRFGGLTYHLRGAQDGNAGYRPCHKEVLKVVQGVVHQPPELGDGTAFYAFSYYFDRAVDAGLIDGVRGGTLEVRDFKKRSKEVCNKMAEGGPGVARPFLCLDLTYITCLLKEGFGFKESTVLQLTKKVNHAEASWSLGAMLDHFYNLKIR
ncbi:ectonucleoside triphosphate diphosphohydrolase 5-like isoform X2 [Gadus chalcogrammus]|uniref:ectonucleoside triphosphate diphosphohydrolase 5-like isoform X2 n=1 Tax=Gadus chalcogrammus TaxID=1042646 RepID=UPI0024C4AD09|nr:ectonucleoside triphosphate diphosphohydrolase 5-like isoform X2 [Gadus chalcogrammus]